jgi:hypothetical protein
MDIKLIRTWEKTLFDTASTNIDTHNLSFCQQHRSLLTVVSDTSALGRASSATFERP